MAVLDLRSHLPSDGTNRGLFSSKVHFRWWQKGGSSSFAIDDVYIGPACPRMCHGRGVCLRGQCQCESGYSGENLSTTPELKSKSRVPFKIDTHCTNGDGDGLLFSPLF